MATNHKTRFWDPELQDKFGNYICDRDYHTMHWAIRASYKLPATKASFALYKTELNHKMNKADFDTMKPTIIVQANEDYALSFVRMDDNFKLENQIDIDDFALILKRIIEWCEKLY